MTHAWPLEQLFFTSCLPLRLCNVWLSNTSGISPLLCALSNLRHQQRMYWEVVTAVHLPLCAVHFLCPSPAPFLQAWPCSNFSNLLPSTRETAQWRIGSSGPPGNTCALQNCNTSTWTASWGIKATLPSFLGRHLSPLPHPHPHFSPNLLILWRML